jgi:hypothetical protein
MMCSRIQLSPTYAGIKASRRAIQKPAARVSLLSPFPSFAVWTLHRQDPDSSKIKQNLPGEFKQEMRKLGTMLLALCHFFDMVATWCFIGIVLLKADSTVELDFLAAGQSYNDFFRGYLALAIVQTLLVAPWRLWTCYTNYNAQVDEEEAAERKEDNPYGDLEAGDDFGFEDDGSTNVSQLSSANAAGLSYGPVQVVTSVLVDLPALILQVMYMTHLGSSPKSVGYNSIAAFTLVFNGFNLAATFLVGHRYFQLFLRPLVGWKEGSITGWDPAQYKMKGYQIALALQTILVLSIAALAWMFVGSAQSDSFEAAKSGLEGSSAGVGTYTTTATVLSVLITVHALYFFFRVLTEFAKMLPPYTGSIKDMVQNLKQGTKFDVKAQQGYNKSRLVETHLAKVAVAGLFVYIPMAVLIGSYHNTMSQSSVDADQYLDQCLPITSHRFDSFESCASAISNGDVDGDDDYQFSSPSYDYAYDDDSSRSRREAHTTSDDDFSLFGGGDDDLLVTEKRTVVTLGPSPSDEAGLGLCVLQIMVSLGYTWAWIRQTLVEKENKKAKDHRLLYLCSWLPGFAVILVQANWAVGAFLFYVNGVKGQAQVVLAEETAVNIDHGTYKKAMMAFSVVGMFVWSIMFYAGWNLMGSEKFNEIEESQNNKRKKIKELEEAMIKKKQAGMSSQSAAASNGSDGAGKVTELDLDKEVFGFGDEEDAKSAADAEAEKMEAANAEVQTKEQELKDAKKELYQNQLMPPLIVKVFVANLMLKTIPHLILVLIFLNRTSTNGIAFYLLLILVADLLVSIRVITTWLHDIHPTLHTLAWIQTGVVATSMLAWRLELKPFAPVGMHMVALISSSLFLVAVGPIMYKCYLVLAKDRENNIDIAQSEKDGTKEEKQKKAQSELGNAAEEPVLLGNRFGTGLEALTDDIKVVGVFAALFFLNTVPNLAAFGGATFQRDEGRPTVVLALLTNAISGAFSLLVVMRWARKRSLTFFFTIATVLVNLIGVLLFFGVTVASQQAGKMNKTVVALTAIFGGIGTLILIPITLRKTWALQDTGIELTSVRGGQFTLDRSKGIVLFGSDAFRERWDNRTVALFTGMFLWSVSIATMQLYVIYHQVDHGYPGVNVTEFSFFCTLVAAAASLVPPVTWLHARHKDLPRIAIGLLTLLMSCWWSWALLFPTGGVAKGTLVMNVIASTVLFPAVLYVCSCQLVFAPSAPTESAGAAISVKKSVAPANPNTVGTDFEMRTRGATVANPLYNTEDAVIHVGDADAADNYLEVGGSGTQTLAAPSDMYIDVNDDGDTEDEEEMAELLGGNDAAADLAAMAELLAEPDAFEDMEVYEDIKLKAVGRLAEDKTRLRQARTAAEKKIGSGSCGALRKFFYKWVAQPMDTKFRDLLTDEATGYDELFDQAIEHRTELPSSHTHRVLSLVVLCLVWCGAMVALHISAFRVPDLSAQELAAGAICLTLVLVVVLIELAMLGWVASRARKSLFWYGALELASWLTVLGLFAGPVGQSTSRATLIAFCVVGTIVFFGQLYLATLHLAGAEQGQTTDLELFDYWGWGKKLPGQSKTKRKDRKQTRMERWFGIRRTHGVPPAIWTGLGAVPLLLRYLPVIVVIASAKNKVQLVTSDDFDFESGSGSGVNRDGALGVPVPIGATQAFALLFVACSTLLSVGIIILRFKEFVNAPSCGEDTSGKRANGGARGGGDRSPAKAARGTVGHTLSTFDQPKADFEADGIQFFGAAGGADDADDLDELYEDDFVPAINTLENPGASTVPIEFAANADTYDEPVVAAPVVPKAAAWKASAAPTPKQPAAAAEQFGGFDDDDDEPPPPPPKKKKAASAKKKASVKKETNADPPTEVFDGFGGDAGGESNAALRWWWHQHGKRSKNPLLQSRRNQRKKKLSAGLTTMMALMMVALWPLLQPRHP